jgi:hypothetical protein
MYLMIFSYKNKIYAHGIKSFELSPLFLPMIPVSPDRAHLNFSSETDSKRFSMKRIVTVINRVGKVAGKVSDVAGKVAVVAALI